MVVNTVGGGLCLPPPNNFMAEAYANALALLKNPSIASLLISDPFCPTPPTSRY